MTLQRREFIAGLGSAAVWPVVARAQQAGRLRRIGVLVNGMEDDSEMQARLAAFRQGLGQFGWSEGRNVRIDYRFSGGSPERLGADRFKSRHYFRKFDPGSRSVASGDPDDSHRIRRRFRSNRLGRGREPSTARRKYHGPIVVRGWHHREVAWDAKGDFATLGKGRYRSEPQVDSLRLLPALSQSHWAFARN